MKKKWIMYENCPKNPRYRVILFHHAGGSASFYNKWKNFVDEDVHICPVQLPMRENRIDENMPEHIKDVVNDFIRENVELFEIPYILLGHSMGGVMAYETAVEIERLGLMPAAAVYVSATNAPGSNQAEIPIRLKNEDLIELLGNYGLMEKEVLDNKDFMDFYLPIAKKDFTLCANYNRDCQERKVICSPIYVLSGNADAFVQKELIMKWKDYTCNFFSYRVFEGDHFYIQNHVKEICEMLKLTMNMCECGVL